MTTDNRLATSGGRETGISREGIDITVEQLALLTELAEKVLVSGKDYGHIPGTAGKKGTLLKPGAANITGAFRAYADPGRVTSIVDPTKGKYGFVSHQVQVNIISKVNGTILASGVGSCNSYEIKYRYRYASPKCPTCGKENIRASKGGGFYCWQKTGGCGANFPANDQRITTQAVGRVENEDPLELDNTLLKMATKRAEVDAAMRLPGVARFFTQDMPSENAGDKDGDRDKDIPEGDQNFDDRAAEVAAEILKEQAERGFCPVHKVPFQHKTGTSKAGKPYDFWSCGEKNTDGKYCQERPQDAPQQPTAATQAPTRPASPPTAPSPAQQAPGAAGKGVLSLGELYNHARRLHGYSPADVLAVVSHHFKREMEVSDIGKIPGGFPAAADIVDDYAKSAGSKDEPEGGVAQ